MGGSGAILPNMSLGDDGQTKGLRAVAHPVRLQILSLLTGAEMSATEIARELDITQANASYHVRVLASAALVVEAGTESIRGGMAKRYRHPWQDGSGQEGARPAGDVSGFIEAMTSELLRRLAFRDTTMSQTNCDAEVWVDPRVWGQVRSMVAEAAVLLHQSARPPRTEGTVHVSMTTALFTMNDRNKTAPETSR